VSGVAVGCHVSRGSWDVRVWCLFGGVATRGMMIARGKSSKQNKQKSSETKALCSIMACVHFSMKLHIE
jgi:hypothetical protein